MKQYLYEIYETTHKNSAPDLTIGLAQFKAEHPEIEITPEEDRALRVFMGRYGKNLSEAFPDRVKFREAVAAGEAEDMRLAEESGKKTQPE